MTIKLPTTESCLFCERLQGEASDWAVVEQTPTTVAFLNPRQFELGQCLVIPRRHAPTIIDLSLDEVRDVMAAAHRLARAIVRAYDPDGLTVYQNNGVASHQVVPHCHVHVVPRRFGSGWGEGPPHLAALDRATIESYPSVADAPIDVQRELANEIVRWLGEID